MSTRITQVLAAGLLALGLAAPVLADPAAFKAGRYDALMLAVTPEHQVEGYYSETLGEGVTRHCAFYVKGRADGAGAVAITSWEREAYPGELAATDDGLVLTVARGREHPGCVSVLAPEIATGLELGRIDSRPWIGLVRVAAEKAYLLERPGGTAGKRPYLIRHDVAGVLEYKDGWARVEYINGDDRSFKGWIRADQYAKLVPPQG